MIAFTSRKQGDTKGTDWAWRIINDPPGLVRYDRFDFVESPAGRGNRPGVRAYVNGLPVIGLQVVRPGDLVRIVHPGARKEETTYLIGVCGAVREPGEGGRCSFTGLPIDGEALRCTGCGRPYKAEVTQELEVCLGCNAPLDRETEFPAEELL